MAFAAFSAANGSPSDFSFDAGLRPLGAAVLRDHRGALLREEPLVCLDFFLILAITPRPVPYSDLTSRSAEPGLRRPQKVVEAIKHSGLQPFRRVNKDPPHEDSRGRSHGGAYLNKRTVARLEPDQQDALAKTPPPSPRLGSTRSGRRAPATADAVRPASDRGSDWAIAGTGEDGAAGKVRS
jgi:hypothetical protein